MHSNFTPLRLLYARSEKQVGLRRGLIQARGRNADADANVKNELCAYIWDESVL